MLRAHSVISRLGECPLRHAKGCDISVVPCLKKAGDLHAFKLRSVRSGHYAVLLAGDWRGELARMWKPRCSEFREAF